MFVEGTECGLSLFSDGGVHGGEALAELGEELGRVGVQEACHVRYLVAKALQCLHLDLGILVSEKAANTVSDITHFSRALEKVDVLTDEGEQDIDLLDPNLPVLHLHLQTDLLNSLVELLVQVCLTLRGLL